MPGLVIAALVLLISPSLNESARAAPAGAAEPPAPLSASTQRPWTIADVVEIARIEGAAIMGSSATAAYVVKRPSLAKGKNAYGLYVVDLRQRGRPRLLLSADYLRDVAWRPGTREWTVRADLGRGVQLYEVSQEGRVEPLLTVADTLEVGGGEGVRTDQVEGPRQVGVLSYQWSPDGRRFWYARLRRRPAAETAQLKADGLVYDDARMQSVEKASLEREAILAGAELRVVDPGAGADRLLAFRPSTPGDATAFRSDLGTAEWADDAHIQYQTVGLGADGAISDEVKRVSVETGAAITFKFGDFEEANRSRATPAGALVTRTSQNIRRLLEIGPDGHVLHDFGPLRGGAHGGSLTYWTDPQRHQLIYETSLGDHHGLDAVRDDSLRALTSQIQGHLSSCSFNRDLSFGVCSLERLAMAPRLIGIDVAASRVAVLDEPNRRYAELASLRSEKRSWRNEFGAVNDGYLTYPLNYSSGRKYPAIVVTHYQAAGDKFAADGFQWEFPLQVFASRGYFVLSVNEPGFDPAIAHPYATADGTNIPLIQFNESGNAAASIVAATKWLLARGDVNPNQIGIAGYSHGAETIAYVLGHSDLFRAASLGDDAGLVASTYWVNRFSRRWFDGLFGGSPYDPAAAPHYREFSLSFRMDRMDAPLLQQFTGAAAFSALEMNGLMEEKGVPTELVVYPGESHVFYDPRHRASAMKRNFDWFEYWLLGQLDPSPEKARQNARWTEQDRRWRMTRDRPEPAR